MKDTLRTSSIRVVREPDAAAIFAKPLDLRYLSPFIGQARLASDVARELGVALTTLAYRIRKLLALGLLEVARKEKRAGSPLRYYRATADAFFVPFAATDAETLEVLLERWDRPWSAIFHRGYAAALSEAGSDWGVSVWRDQAGELRVAPQLASHLAGTPKPETVPALLDELVLGLRLTPEAVVGLKREVLEVIQRYADRQAGEKGGRAHFVRVTLTPLAGMKVLP